MRALRLNLIQSQQSLGKLIRQNHQLVEKISFLHHQIIPVLYLIPTDLHLVLVGPP